MWLTARPRLISGEYSETEVTKWRLAMSSVIFSRVKKNELSFKKHVKTKDAALKLTLV